MFKIAIVGDLSDDRKLLSMVDELMAQVRGAVEAQQKDEQLNAADALLQKKEKQDDPQENSKENAQEKNAQPGGINVTHQQEQLWLLVSPFYTAQSWEKWVKESRCPVKCMTVPGQESWEARQTVCVHTKQRDFVGERICADADLLLVVWDESPEALDGSTLEILRMARRKDLACIWFSSRTGKRFWPEETLFMPFSVNKLEHLCQDKTVPLLKPSQSGDEHRIPFLWIGMKLQAAYLKKYKAAPPAVLPTEDHMLKENYEMPESFHEQEPLRKRILEQYNLFDRSAIQLNAKYQGAAYWQAILPFIITGFLALGFYSEDILGVLSIPVIILQVLSGIGFLMNAYLNLYKYSLDKSRLVRKWQISFVQNRGIAELLRVLIHFIPFGFNLDLQKLCGEDPAIYHTIREITSDTRPGTIDVDQRSAKEVLRHLKEMVEDQLAYHEASVKRYRGIVNTLNKWAKTIFFAGFAFVVARACFKFTTLLWPVTDAPLGNVTVRTFAGTGANMLAMLLPAWAAYFSTKLSQCSYQYNLDNHRHMVTSLKQISEQVNMIESNFPEVPLEYVSALGESVAQTMLVEDTTMWMQWYRRNA